MVAFLLTYQSYIHDLVYEVLRLQFYCSLAFFNRNFIYLPHCPHCQCVFVSLSDSACSLQPSSS